MNSAELYMWSTALPCKCKAEAQTLYSKTRPIQNVLYTEYIICNDNLCAQKSFMYNMTYCILVHGIELYIKENINPA